MKYTTYGMDTPGTLGDCTTRFVEGAPDYYAGELESIHSKQEALLKVVNAIADALPPGAARSVAEALDFSIEDEGRTK